MRRLAVVQPNDIAVALNQWDGEQGFVAAAEAFARHGWWGVIVLSLPLKQLQL